MKIGIDVTMLVYQGSGVANYTYNLVKTLLEIDKKNEYRLFYSSFHKKNIHYLDEFKNLGAKIYHYRFPFKFLQFCWEKLNIIPVELFIGKVDWFLSSDFLRPPLLSGTKGITTVHDLVWKMYPQFHEDWIISAHEKKLEKTIKYHDVIITDSQNTKKDLIKYYPNIKKTNQIHVLYPAISETFKVINDKKKVINVLKKYQVLPVTSHEQRVTIPNFLLYVGAIEPRKNLVKAIEVFHQLITNHQPAYRTGRQLITNFYIVGRAGWKNEEVFQSIKRLRLEDKVKFVGFVDDEDLPYFYNGAKAFIYLSKYEGFGLPPIEAAACGKMVLMYENSSLKEIFKSNYPYAQEGKELETLKEILDNKYNIKDYLIKFSWRDYVKKFSSFYLSSTES